jgi:hypothetical protein
VSWYHREETAGKVRAREIMISLVLTVDPHNAV